MGISLFAPQLYSFMGPETANIKSIFMWFSHVFQGENPMKMSLILAMKILWKITENPVTLPWKKSLDFYGFLFSSERGLLKHFTGSTT